eukprot:gnl/Spiro4/26707_TR13269_c0_g1_i1.p1 gnl/Spiro4/26707_TR13269_c0_g1~~gnl/Spiro4/26707_TR13269_c0_g1_i1.p1  ORF type:complete len:244 (+),score=25.57 gnl/Spiro4/26707_TR13269_c0_g1_i1:74-805(+)
MNYESDLKASLIDTILATPRDKPVERTGTSPARLEPWPSARPRKKAWIPLLINLACAVVILAACYHSSWLYSHVSVTWRVATLGLSGIAWCTAGGLCQSYSYSDTACFAISSPDDCEKLASLGTSALILLIVCIALLSVAAVSHGVFMTSPDELVEFHHAAMLCTLLSPPFLFAAVLCVTSTSVKYNLRYDWPVPCLLTIGVIVTANVLLIHFWIVKTTKLPPVARSRNVSLDGSIAHMSERS